MSSYGVADRLEALGVSSRGLLIAVCFVPLVAFFVIVWAVPILYTLGMSLFANPTSDASFVGLGNYVAVVTDASFLPYLANSVVYAVGTTGASLVVGLALALVVNQRLRGGNLLRALMILPYLVPTLVVIFMWKFILDPNVGVVNQWLIEAGVLQKPVAFFATLTWAMPAVVVTSVWKFASFAFFILLARLQAIDPALYERAKVEGATTWQAFRDITLPNLRNAILIVLLVRGIWMFNKFDIIFLSTHGGPLKATTTLPIWIYHLAFSLVDFGRATALAGVMFALLAVVAAVYFAVLSPSEEVAD